MSKANTRARLGAGFDLDGSSRSQHGRWCQGQVPSGQRPAPGPEELQFQRQSVVLMGEQLPETCGHRCDVYCISVSPENCRQTSNGLRGNCNCFLR